MRNRNTIALNTIILVRNVVRNGCERITMPVRRL